MKCRSDYWIECYLYTQDPDDPLFGQMAYRVRWNGSSGTGPFKSSDAAFEYANSHGGRYKPPSVPAQPFSEN